MIEEILNMKRNSRKLNDLKIIAKFLVILLVPFIDFDGDQLSTYSEIFSHSTNAFNSDSDYDQLTDGEEVKKYLTNPNLDDTDGDTLLDGEEVNTHRTNPNLKDTDGDRLEDNYELTPRYLGSTGFSGTYCEKRFYPGSDPTKYDTYNIGDGIGDSMIHKYTYICIDPYCGTLVTKFC